MEENQTTTQPTKPKKKKSLQNIVLAMTLLVAIGLGVFFYYANQKRTKENFTQQANTFSEVVSKVNQISPDLLINQEPANAEELDSIIEEERVEIEEIQAALTAIEEAQTANQQIKSKKLQPAQEKAQKIYSDLEKKLKNYQQLAEYSNKSNQASRDLFEVILIYSTVKQNSSLATAQNWYDVFSAINYTTGEMLSEMEEISVPDNLTNYHQKITDNFQEVVDISAQFMTHMEAGEVAGANVQLPAFENKLAEISQLDAAEKAVKQTEQDLDDLQKEAKDLKSQMTDLQEELGTEAEIAEVKEW